LAELKSYGAGASSVFDYITNLDFIIGQHLMPGLIGLIGNLSKIEKIFC
jgi:hypothetical protein